MAKKTAPAKTVAIDQDKQTALDTALKNIEKSFGKGAVMRLGDESAKLDADVI